MQIRESVERYISYVKRQFSLGTHRYYKSHLGHFLLWADKREILDIEDIKYYVFDDYIADMKQTCSNTTINKRIGMLKRWSINQNHDLPYLHSIKKLKERRTTFKMIDHRTMNKIKKYVHTLDVSIYNNLVYKTMVLLLIDTGARINEVLSIEIKNIDVKKNEILLTTTKTKSDRVVYFRNDTKKLIQDTIKKSRSNFLLYNNEKDRLIKYEDVRFFFRKMKRILDIDELHPHMFRHTMATNWLEAGADLISVMETLGHKNLETTERYLHVNKKHIKKTYMEKYKG
ncbi:MAG: tyrosine-type recombinase/integrase [Acholeplasma sp.]|nr:tyrosine-type recombinase/integrase [Acholeplasma sp.]